MSLYVLNPGESLVAILSAAVTTTAPSCATTWRELNNEESNQPIAALSDTSATLVAAPVTASQQRIVDSIQVHNRDTVAATVSIAKVVSGTTYAMFAATIPAGATLVLTKDGARTVDSSGQLLQSVNEGAGTVGVAATNVTAAETGGLVRKTVLTLTNVSVTVGNTTGVSFGGTKIYDFPEGRILILGATVAGVTFDLTDEGNATPIAAADGGDIAIGTTVPDDGTLTDTDVDIIPSTSIDPISAGVDGAALAASAQFDGTTTPVDAFFNILIDDADVEDAASDVILVSGTLTLHWVLLGDY